MQLFKQIGLAAVLAVGVVVVVGVKMWAGRKSEASIQVAG